jgi:hypothetical protein
MLCVARIRVRVAKIFAKCKGLILAGHNLKLPPKTNHHVIKQHHSPSSRQPVEISKKRSESLLTTAFLFDIKESKNGIHRAPYQSARNYIKLPSDEF